jgi:CRISPR type IV-associated protein Csf3
MDGLFPLDSILAAEWVRRNHPDKFYNDGARAGLIEPALPLAKTEVAGEWVWSASVAQYRCYGEYTHYWHKRLRPYITGRYIDSPKKINVASGQYKGYRMPVNVLLVGPLTWFCVGDPDGVRELLMGVKSLGKKRAYGFGMVELDHRGRPAWKVEPWSEDWSVYGPGGRLMRTVPFDGTFREDATLRQWGIRPPYWHFETQRLVLMPKVGDWDD